MYARVGIAGTAPERVDDIETRYASPIPLL